MKRSLFLYIILVLVCYSKSYATDTLYTNPNYPPIVYEGEEFDFYRYTAKYVPDNLLHAFKILGANDPMIIAAFKRKDVGEVIESGLFFPASRLRKEFCLEGYSGFVPFFHNRGIYYPYAMETYILLGFHQYLKGEKIDWKANKKQALDGFKKSNRKWRRRKQKLFKRGKVKVKEAPVKSKKKKDQPHPDPLFKGEFK